MDLYKAPGVAETLDWTRSLLLLDATTLDTQTVSDTLGALLKYQDDLARFPREAIGSVLEEARAQVPA